MFWLSSCVFSCCLVKPSRVEGVAVYLCRNGMWRKVFRMFVCKVVDTLYKEFMRLYAV